MNQLDELLGQMAVFFAGAVRRVRERRGLSLDRAADKERVAEWRGLVVDALMAAGDADLARDAHLHMLEAAAVALSAVAFDFGTDAGFGLDDESIAVAKARLLLAASVAELWSRD